MIVWLGLIGYIVFIRALLGALDSHKKKAMFLVMANLGVVFVLGSRYPHYEIEWDLEVYYDYYELMERTPWNQIFMQTERLNAVAHFEPGYIIMNKLLATVIPWPQFILYFEAAFCVGTVAYFILKNTDYVFGSYICYLCTDLFILQLTGFRQAFAIGICLLSVEAIKNRKLFRFLLLCALACMFHKTAIFFIPAYFYINAKLNFKQKVISLVLVVLVALFGEPIMLAGIELMDMHYGVTESTGLSGLITLFLYIIAVFFSFSKRNEEDEAIGVNMTVVGMMTYLLRFVVRVADRLSSFYSAGLFIALPKAVATNYHIKQKRGLYACVLLGLIFLFIRMLLKSDFIPYRFFWQ